MIVCDFCKKKVVIDETYILPMHKKYCTELIGNGIVWETIGRIEDKKVTLCASCRRRLAEFLRNMEE